MKYLIVILLTWLFGGYALAQDSCGDPPQVADESLKGELNGQAQFLSRFIGDAQLKGRIETSRIAVFDKYPNADKLIIDYYLIYETCNILMRDTTLSTNQKLEEMRKTRREFLTVSSTQIIAKTCRHQDFGIERWGNEETVNQSSGWQGGGSNQVNWCNSVKNRFIQGRSIGPLHVASTVRSSEEARWSGTLGRTRQYNYHCIVKIQWNPIFNERQDASRCGTF